MQTDAITSTTDGPRPSPPDPDDRARAAWLVRRVPSTRGLAFAAVYVIWGSTYLAIRVGVASIPPLLLAGARSFLAGGILLGWWLLRGARPPNRAEWGRAAVSGIAMLTGGNGLVTLAETHVPSNLAALMIAGLPAYVALLDWLRPGG
ncbi:MAG TPA: EamA family transporter, partial [Polyangiaceae bacterium]|nr:EamA family transporter [Polyangiaceae bacterium]